jgi:hypothetical protein
MSDLVRVQLDTECELYPELQIVESPDLGRFDIPRELWDALRAAQARVDEAEHAIMRYVGARYPDVAGVQSWLRDRS